MVSKAKVANVRSIWISEAIWNTMTLYLHSDDGLRRSRIASEIRLSNRDGYGPHAHTAGARSFNQRQRNGVEPSMLQVLRETHRRPDGTYVDARAESIDQEIQRQINEGGEGTESESLDAGTDASSLTQLQEDEIYYMVVQPSQGGRIFGVGGLQSVQERGESSNMGARVRLERQVRMLEEQLATVVERLEEYMAAGNRSEPNLSTTPRTTGSATGRANFDATDMETEEGAANMNPNEDEAGLSDEEFFADA